MKMLALIICAVLSWNLQAETSDKLNDPNAWIMAAVEDTTGWTTDELKAGLDNLDRLYKNEMKTEAGRKRWHGDIVKSELNEERMVMIETHEDGFVYERPASKVKQLSEAQRIELNAKREEMRKRRVAITNEVSVVIKPEGSK